MRAPDETERVLEAMVSSFGGIGRQSGLVDHLPDVDVFGAKTGLAVVEIKLPQLLEAVVEAERHDLFPGFPEAQPPFGERAGIVLREDPLAEIGQALFGAERFQDRRRRQHAAREDVALDEIWP